MSDWRLPKSNYPPMCPARSAPCDAGCNIVDCAWHDVFLSIPFNAWYANKRKALELKLQDKGFTPVTADRGPGGVSLSEAIAKSICRSSHAVIDISPDATGRSPLGVLMENGFLRAVLGQPDILLLAHDGCPVPAEAKALQFQTYHSIRQVEEHIDEWVRDLHDAYTRPMQHLLFEDVPTPLDYDVWYHCRTPAVNRRPGGWPPNALTGGWSGYQLLHKAFDALKPSKDHHICQTERCYIAEEYAATETAGREPADLKESDKGKNLYLLDAPIGRAEYPGQSPRFRTKPLNWIMLETLERLQSKVEPLTIHMDIINPDGEGRDEEIARDHPEEVKKLVYGHTQEFVVASAEWDYGFVIRAPNPYRTDGRGIAVLIAGLHAPATHVAAEILSVPARAREFVEGVRRVWRTDLSQIAFFEAVVKVRRTYHQRDLGKIELVHFQDLSLKRRLPI